VPRLSLLLDALSLGKARKPAHFQKNSSRAAIDANGRHFIYNPHCPAIPSPIRLEFHSFS
jgi:hypothetical protein